MEADPLDRAMDLPGAKRYARYVAAVCPFHEDNKPSLLVYANGFRCTACGARGSLAMLWRQADLRPLMPSVSKADYHPSIPKDMSNDRIARSAHKILLRNPGLQEYLIKRGLERAIHRYGLGYWDGWYTIPVTDEDGDVDEIIFRAGPFIQEQTGSRFFQRWGQKPRMYVPDWKKLKPGNTLFVTFGLFDAVTLALMGYAAATSTIGKGSFKPEWLSWWGEYIVIVPDKGEEKEANLLAAGLGWRSRVLRLPYPDECKDPNDFYQHDPHGLKEIIDGFGEHLRNRCGLDDPEVGGRSAQMRPERRRPNGIGATL